MSEQVAGISGVDILEHDGSCSEGGGCLAGQIRTLRSQNAIFSAVKKEPVFSVLQPFSNCSAENKYVENRVPGITESVNSL